MLIVMVEPEGEGAVTAEEAAPAKGECQSSAGQTYVLALQ